MEDNSIKNRIFKILNYKVENLRSLLDSYKREIYFITQQEEIQ
jgi:hypothetical protein